MANHHIYRDLRPMKNILNGQKVFAKKISHAPYRYTLAQSIMEEPTQGMKLETDKIRIELTKPEYLQDIIFIEQENSDFIGQYDFNEHFAVIESIDELHLSIFEKSTNLLTGFIVLAGLKDTNNSIEFRRIAVTKKGKGIGSDAVMLIKKYCFELLNAHRIWLDVFEENNRAIRLYKAQGFKTEGLLREAIKRNGQYRSLRIMSALVNDYDAVYPLQIDHTCLIVQNIKETSEYLQKLFDFEIKLKHDYNDTLICENKDMHFFVLYRPLKSSD
jgi:RimJ/RimL family protein N-acetyltransferase